MDFIVIGIVVVVAAFFAYKYRDKLKGLFGKAKDKIDDLKD
jgi:hypothetical protein